MEKDLARIKAAIEKHRWAYAERELLKRLKAQPDDLDLLDLLRGLYWQREDDEKACKIAQKVHSLEPNSPMGLWSYASCLSNVDKDKDAIELYKAILRKAHRGIAKDSRIRTTRRARGFKLDVHVRMGECYAYIGDYERAVSHFKKYLRGYEKSMPSMYTKTEVKQYWKDALLEYLYTVEECNHRTYQIAREAYAAEPNDPNVLWSFAAWSNNIGRYEEAIKLYKRILRKRNHTLAKHTDAETLDAARGFKLDVCVRIAECYMWAGDYEHATAYLKRFLRQKSKEIPTEYGMRKVKGYLKECEAEISG